MTNIRKPEPFIADKGYLKIQETPNSLAKEYLKVSLPIDGNDAFYALALGLQMLITTNQYSFSNANYQLLVRQFHKIEQYSAMEHRRVAYIHGSLNKQQGNNSKTTADRLNTLLTAMRKNRLNSAEQFKFFLLSNRGYESISAVTIYLAHVLRTLSIEALNSEPAYSSIVPATDNGKSPEPEQLMALCNRLNLDLAIYDQNLNSLHQLAGGDTNAPERKELSLTLHTEGPCKHYQLLVPKVDYEQEPYYLALYRPKSIKSEALALFQEKVLKDKSQFKDKQFKEYRGHLRNLESEINLLSKPEECRAGALLLKTLQEHAYELFTIDPQRQRRALDASQQALTQAQKCFKSTHHRSFANILVNLALFLGSLGVGYALVSLIHYSSTGRFTFFNKPSMSASLPKFSAQLLENTQAAGLPKTSDLKCLEAPPSWSSITI